MNTLSEQCWLCGGTRHHDMMYDIVIDNRIVYFGKTCHDEILTQHVLDFESKDKAMSERANRHEAEAKEEPITLPNDKGIPFEHASYCRCDDCTRMR